VVVVGREPSSPNEPIQIMTDLSVSLMRNSLETIMRTQILGGTSL